MPGCQWTSSPPSLVPKIGAMPQVSKDERTLSECRHQDAPLSSRHLPRMAASPPTHLACRQQHAPWSSMAHHRVGMSSCMTTPRVLPSRTCLQCMREYHHESSAIAAVSLSLPAPKEANACRTTHFMACGYDPVCAKSLHIYGLPGHRL